MGVSAASAASETVAQQMANMLQGPPDWSAYVDETWDGRQPGEHRMQRRVRHLMRRLGLDPARVPSSNVVFVRTAREAHLAEHKQDLLEACWPVHEAVIKTLGIGVVVCLGGTAGRWVAEKLGATQRVDSFTEQNLRGWTSSTHRNEEGQSVVALAHPAVADWTRPPSDPSELVMRALTSRQA